MLRLASYGIVNGMKKEDEQKKIMNWTFSLICWLPYTLR